MHILLLLDKVKNKLRKKYREKIFKLRTGQTAHLVGNYGLINTNLKFGKNVTIYPGVQFFGDGQIEIGDNVTIGNNTILYASKDGGIKIGTATMIAAQCYIIDVDHGIKAGELISKQPNTVAPITIGSDVWIAAGAKVLKGSVIENGAVIGAQSLVKGHIAENSIAVGIPAKEIKKRTENE